MKKVLGVLAPLLLLAACDSGITIYDICQQNPELCARFPGGGHCNESRSKVLMDGWAESRLPSDANRYNMLISLEHYNACIELASKIEHIKLKEKKTQRIEGYLESIKEIKRLSEATRTSDYPHLLYYHFSRNGDQRALDKFLALEAEGKLNSAELQYGLATYYTKRDPEKARDLLLKALALHKPDVERLNPEIFIALTNDHYNRDELKSAYIWARISEMAGLTNIKMKQLELELEARNLSKDRLDDIAETTWDQLNSGTFKQPSFKG